MANTNLVHDLVMKESMRHFRNSSAFLNTINTRYDDSYAMYGAKEGANINIQVPQEFSVGSGKTLDVQDAEEKQVTISRSVQRHVGIKYSSAELTQDQVMGGPFSRNKIQPAMAALAAVVENYCLDLAYKEVYNAVALPVTALDRDDILNAGVELDEGATPRDGQRMMLLCPKGMSQVVSDSTGLFNAAKPLSQQYKDGVVDLSPVMGFNFGMSQNVDTHTTGGYDGAYLVNGVPTEGSKTLAVDTGTGTLTVGDILTIANVNRVNPNTKQSTGDLQKFVVTAAYAGGAGNVSVEPAFISTGPYQNIDALPANNAAITELGTLSTAYRQNLAYHRGFAAIGFCDLATVPNEDMSRLVEDQVSMRVWRFSDGINDDHYFRIDVLFGYKTVIPRWACRIYQP